VKALAYILSLISAISLLASCLSEEGFATTPSAKLTSSIDTLSLDTVIAGVPTNTYTFQIYNPTEENLRITRISLQTGQDSPFRVNIDGTYLREEKNSNWEIYGKDSLRVFVELTVPETSFDTPQEIEDKLSFQSDVPYLIRDSLVVPEGRTLTLTAGTRLYFHPSSKLIVYGRLVAQGTVKKNIILRGDRMGYMFSQQPYDRIPGQWGGIVFKNKSIDNILDFCDIHSSDFGIKCDSSDISATKLTLSNSIIHNISGDALTLDQCKTEIGNPQITNAGGNCVSIVGGDNTFTHCTIGQFYSFVGGRGVALKISNVHGEIYSPISKAIFRNCLITGYNADDIHIETSRRYTEEELNYQFDHCLLNTPQVSDNQRFVACVFETELPEKERNENHFWPAFDFQKLLFPFTLRANSPLEGKADVNLFGITIVSFRIAGGILVAGVGFYMFYCN